MVPASSVANYKEMPLRNLKSIYLIDFVENKNIQQTDGTEPYCSIHCEPTDRYTHAHQRERR
jgi:hypothetical protein